MPLQISAEQWIEQAHWGYLAYAVGFGGSMIWFGSSAGVALSNQYAEAKSVGRWLCHGWRIPLACVIDLDRSR